MPLHDAIFMEPGLAGAKHGLTLLGQHGRRSASAADAGDARRPARSIRSAMVHAGLIN